MRLWSSLLAVAFVFALSPSAAWAQVNTMGGYDVVAYFTDHAAVRGSSEHAFTWHGAAFHFASEAHRATFAASPARYAPAYGGYCAYAAADGRLVSVDPSAWSIVRGRLYLNDSLEIRSRWLSDRDHSIEEADRRWPELSSR